MEQGRAGGQADREAAPAESATAPTTAPTTAPDPEPAPGAARRRPTARIAGAAVVLLAAVAVAGWAATRTTSTAPPSRPTSTSTSATTLPGLVTYTGLSRNHVSGPVSYPQTPPVGGDHAPIWQNCGIYATPVADEYAVHSLEHGAIWVTYRPDLPAAQVAVLRSVVGRQAYGLLSPYPGLPAPVVVTVWGVQLRLDSATDPRLAAFVARYADGSTAPEPLARCTDGVGTPQLP